MADTIDVLIVEDSRTDMHRTIEILRRTNRSLSIHQATTLSEGIGACVEATIDLVLLDLTLPDSFGFETVQHFRRAVSALPIVVLTGMSDEEIAAECMNSGANNFLSKIELTAQKMEQIIFVTLSHFAHSRS